MSVFYEFQDILDDFKLCVMSIEDDYVPSSSIEVPANILNPYKRLQFVAAREALLQIQPDFPLGNMQVTETGKPYIPGFEGSFSLSHSSNYAAALISKSPDCGFDIELPGKKVSAIRDKFLSPSEYKNVERSLKYFFPNASDFIFYGLCWSAKESVYKWLGRRNLDFRENMQLFPSKNDFNTNIPFLNCKITIEGEEEKVVPVYLQIKKPLVITWVTGSASSNPADE